MRKHPAMISALTRYLSVESSRAPGKNWDRCVKNRKCARCVRFSGSFHSDIGDGFQRVMRPFRICLILRKSVAGDRLRVQHRAFVIASRFFSPQPATHRHNSRDVRYPVLFVYLFIVCDIWLQRCALFILHSKTIGSVTTLLFGVLIISLLLPVASGRSRFFLWLFALYSYADCGWG